MISTMHLGMPFLCLDCISLCQGKDDVEDCNRLMQRDTTATLIAVAILFTSSKFSLTARP